jgi:hypothetical protein
LVKKLQWLEHEATKFFLFYDKMLFIISAHGYILPSFTPGEVLESTLKLRTLGKSSLT